MQDVFNQKLFYSSNLYSIECQSTRDAQFQQFIQELFALSLKRALPSLRALAMSSAYAWRKAVLQKILACQSSSLRIPNPEVIHLEKQKENIFVILLPDEEDFNLLENDKRAFGQAVGIAPWIALGQGFLPAFAIRKLIAMRDKFAMLLLAKAFCNPICQARQQFSWQSGLQASIS